MDERRRLEIEEEEAYRASLRRAPRKDSSGSVLRWLIIILILLFVAGIARCQATVEPTAAAMPLDALPTLSDRTIGRDFYLDRGDRAFSTGGEVTCTGSPHRGSRNGFICKVGGDYRAKFGVIINEREVAITQYTAFSRYRVVVRKRQSAAATAP